MATKDSDITFIQEKIMDIQYAMFSNNLNSEFCLFNNVIKTLKTDRDGNIWFFTSCRGDYAKNTIGQFFTRLDYYQKGRDFRVHITGKSSIVETDSDINAAEIASSDIVLVKCKIMLAEYVEFTKPDNSSLKQKASKFINDYFFPNASRQFDFSSPSPNKWF